jgi:hypothetical protein
MFDEHNVIITRGNRGSTENTSDHSTTFIEPHELIFLTVHYECMHDMLRPVRRITASFDQLANNSREIFSPDPCSLCSSITRAKQATARERKRGLL